MSISIVLYNLFLLQTDLTAFGGKFRMKSASPVEAVIFVSGIVLAIIILLIVNSLKKKSNSPALTGAAPAPTTPRRFSSFTLRRLANGMGLNRAQTKMLDFVFKSDNVVNPFQSINNPAMLDQHFRRAYRLIDRDSGNDAEVQEKLSVLFATRNVLEANSDGGNINSTRQVPDNTAAVLGVENESYPVRVISAKGEHMVVETPQTAMGAAVRVSRGSKVTISFFTKSSKGFSFESRVIGTIESKKGPELQLVHSSQIKRLSQRRFRRRQVVLSANIFLVFVEDKRMVVDKRKLSGNILDISLGGCSIKTNATINSGARIKIEFTQGKNSGAALGQVLRTNRSGASTIMHIKFMKIPRKSMNIINAFVYEYEE